MPETIDPDRWLERVNHQAFTRTVQADGGVTINRQEYYLNRRLAARPHLERTRRDAVWLCPLCAQRKPQAVWRTEVA